MMSIHIRKLYSCFLFLFILLTGRSLYPAENSLFLDITPGFSGILKWGYSIPVTITLKNNAGPVKGKLLLETIQGNSYGENFVYMHYSQEISLARGITKDFSFILESWNFAYPLTAHLIVNNEIIIKKEIDILPPNTSNKIVLCLSTSPFLNFLNYESRGQNTFQVIYPPIQQLPDLYKGYDMVDMIVAYDTDLSPLTREQRTSIADWVSRGGTLVMSAKQLFGPLKEFIHLNSKGYVQKTTLPSLEKTYKQPLPPGPGFPVLDSAPNASSTVLLSDGNLPLVIQETYDQGNIFLCTFDFGTYPFTEWEGRYDFWIDFLKTDKKVYNKGIDYREKSFEDELFSAYLSQKSPEIQSRFIFLYSFIILYTLIILVLFFAPDSFLFKGNTDVKYRTLIIVSFVFSVVGWFLFHYHIPGQGAYTAHAGVITQQQNTTYADIHYYTGIFSFNNKAYSIQYPSEISGVRVFSPARDKRKSYTLEIESLKKINRIHPGKWDSIQVNAHARIRFPFYSTLEVGTSFYNITIKNNTGYNLKDTLFLYTDSVYHLGSIPSGTRVKKTIEKTDMITGKINPPALSPLQ